MKRVWNFGQDLPNEYFNRYFTYVSLLGSFLPVLDYLLMSSIQASFSFHFLFLWRGVWRFGEFLGGISPFWPWMRVSNVTLVRKSVIRVAILP